MFRWYLPREPGPAPQKWGPPLCLVPPGGLNTQDHPDWNSDTSSITAQALLLPLSFLQKFPLVSAQVGCDSICLIVSPVWGAVACPVFSPLLQIPAELLIPQSAELFTSGPCHFHWVRQIDPDGFPFPPFCLFPNYPSPSSNLAFSLVPPCSCKCYFCSTLLPDIFHLKYIVKILVVTSGRKDHSWV